MGFENYHPAINLIYFVSVIWAALCFQQPVFLAVSFCCAFVYSAKRGGRRTVIFNLCLIPLVILFALSYSGCHHFGVTILRQNFIGNNMTMEALLYGLTLGITGAAAAMWLGCVFSIFTADKVVYLFGRFSPRLSLFLAILLRMVPRLKQQAGRISTARKALGRGIDQGNILRRMVNGVRIFSMLITWLLEALATISGSMRSRGCALKGRTAFSIYRFDNRDRGLVIGMFTCLTVTTMAVVLGQTDMTFAPRIIMEPVTPGSAAFYIGYAVLCLLPMALEVICQFRFEQLRMKV